MVQRKIIPAIPGIPQTAEAVTEYGLMGIYTPVKGEVRLTIAKAIKEMHIKYAAVFMGLPVL